MPNQFITGLLNSLSGVVNQQAEEKRAKRQQETLAAAAAKKAQADQEQKKAMKQIEVDAEIKKAQIRADADTKKALAKFNDSTRSASAEMIDLFRKGDYEGAFAFGATSRNPADKIVLRQAAELQKIMRQHELRMKEASARFDNSMKKQDDQQAGAVSLAQTKAGLRNEVGVSGKGASGKKGADEAAIIGKQIANIEKQIKGMEDSGKSTQEIEEPVPGLLSGIIRPGTRKKNVPTADYSNLVRQRDELLKKQQAALQRKAAGGTGAPSQAAGTRKPAGKAFTAAMQGIIDMANTIKKGK